MTDITTAPTKDPTTKPQRVVGWVLWAIVVPFFVFDMVLHLWNPPFVQEASKSMALPATMIPLAGWLMLGCLGLYMWPRTSVLGAVLLTGYLGAAIALQVRINGSWVFALVMGVFVWASLWCRDVRVRSLIS